MSFTDFNALQRDHAHILLSDPWLSEVNIVMRAELLEDTALARLPDQTYAAEVLAYITPRNQASGRIGCGIIVERPRFNVISPNVTGPQAELTAEFLILCNPLENEAPSSGTLRPGDEVAQRILDLLHLHADDGVGTFAGSTIVAADDFAPLDAWRVRLTATVKRLQTTRVARVTSSIASGECTLTCTTSEASIWFTLAGQDADGNWLEPGPPAPSNTGGGAQLYAAPFAVTSGQIIRACAFKQNLNPSPITRVTA